MSYKLVFRFDREDYSPEGRTRSNEEIRSWLHERFSKKEIIAERMFVPSRNSIKVIFQTEEEANKVLENKVHFYEKGFDPKITMAMKASRTIFCAGFDQDIITRYNQDDIKGYLEQRGWKVEGVYIMRNSRAIKIEFKTKQEATSFLTNINTSIGHVKLGQENKEREVDPTIRQCWGCGVLEPNHNTSDCRGTQICLKCGDRDHKFFQCRIPRKLEDMTDQQKQSRFCAPCNKRGEHTSLDHSACPKKREIVRERARLARTKQSEENNNNQRDIELIKRVVDFSNTESWPQINQQQTKVSAIISLALIEEAVTPGVGVFQKKLTQGSIDNGIPQIKYQLETNTAKAFFQAITGATRRDMAQINTEVTQASVTDSVIRVTTGTLASEQEKLSLSRHYRDSTGGSKRNLDFRNTMDTEEQTNSDIYISAEKKAKQRSPTTHEMQPNTNTMTSTPDPKKLQATSQEMVEQTPKYRLDKFRRSINSIPLEIIRTQASAYLFSEGQTEKEIDVPLEGFINILDTIKIANYNNHLKAMRDEAVELLKYGLGQDIVSLRLKLTDLTPSKNGASLIEPDFHLQ